ncbi:MAG: hypothetical protein IKS31_09040 [Clostridia bacterium]|nr:hypothetical protein [Clostridia bacterium]
MKRRLTAMLLLAGLLLALGTALADFRYASVWSRLNQKMATRSGPGTQYDEPGTFFSAGTDVQLVSRAYDSANGIWWVQADFDYHGKRIRAYTGAKRFDNLYLSSLPEEVLMGWGHTSDLGEAWAGPGYNYQSVRNVPAYTYATIYCYVYNPGEDADYIQIEFYDSNLGRYRRAWIKEWAFNAEYMDYGRSW